VPVASHPLCLRSLRLATVQSHATGEARGFVLKRGGGGSDHATGGRWSSTTSDTDVVGTAAACILEIGVALPVSDVCETRA
jgi:hypothetical protein